MDSPQPSGLAEKTPPQLTREQMQTIHKLTVFKYAPKREPFIGTAEYEKLTPFLKGYAYRLQFLKYPVGNPIVLPLHGSDQFTQGIEQAESEING